MTDPYRTSGRPTLVCARCQQALVERASYFDCPAGCGMWDGATSIDGTAIAKLGTAIEPPKYPARCAACRKPTNQRDWDGIRVEVCGGHGIWVDRSWWKAFIARVTSLRAKVEEARGTEQLARDVARLLEDPVQRLVFARRFLALEAQVATLASRLEAVERRIPYVATTD